MKLFLIKETGPYALSVSVHRAHDEETLLKSLGELSNPFGARRVIELSPDGEPETLFETYYIE